MTLRITYKSASGLLPSYSLDWFNVRMFHKDSKTILIHTEVGCYEFELDAILEVQSI